MNIKNNYENLIRAKEILEDLIESSNFDEVVKTRLNNVSSRISLTLIDLDIERRETRK